MTSNSLGGCLGAKSLAEQPAASLQPKPLPQLMANCFMAGINSVPKGALSRNVTAPKGEARVFVSLSFQIDIVSNREPTKQDLTCGGVKQPKTRPRIGTKKQGRSLGDTTKGLTGTEIEYLLRDRKIPDVSPEMTKWKRLFNAFLEWQNQKQVGNHVLMFINRAMNPVQYTTNRELFGSRRDELNVVMAFCGMTVAEDGRVRRVTVAHNLDDAMERARRLHGALANRKVHQDVLKFCKAELLDENYFHAVFEAIKSIAAKIR